MRAAIRMAWPCLVLATLGLACAGGTGPTEPPEWVDGAPAEYDGERYVWGVGSGSSRDAATAAAVEAVARKTQGEREGVRIEETWTDESRAVLWALAVLDRAETLDRLSDELAVTDARIRELLTTGGSGPPEQALPAVARALDLTRRRDTLLERMARLQDAPIAVDAGLARELVQQRLDAIKRQLTVDVQAYEMDPETGAVVEPLDEVRRALAQQVVERGLRLARADSWGAAPSWLRVRARVGFDRLQLAPEDRFVAVHWDAVVEIEDGSAEGDVLAILSREARAAELNESEARRQALRGAERFVATAFGSWLDERLAGSAQAAADGQAEAR